MTDKTSSVWPAAILEQAAIIPVICSISAESNSSSGTTNRHYTTANLTLSSGTAKALNKASSLLFSFRLYEMASKRLFYSFYSASRQKYLIRWIMLMNRSFTIGSSKCLKDAKCCYLFPSSSSWSLRADWPNASKFCSPPPWASWYLPVITSSPG